VDVYVIELPFWAVTVYASVAAAAGISRGGRDGVVVALIVLVQLAIAWALPGVNPHWLALTLDLVGLVILLALVLTGRNYWTIVAAATAVLAVTTHGLRVTVDLTEWGYYSAQRAWALLLDTALLVGSLLQRRSGRAGGR